MSLPDELLLLLQTKKKFLPRLLLSARALVHDCTCWTGTMKNFSDRQWVRKKKKITNKSLIAAPYRQLRERVGEGHLTVVGKFGEDIQCVQVQA